MATLIIKRISGWSNMRRDISIYLNGEKIGVIGNEKIKEFEIEPGEHQLRTKIDWCGSKTITFKITDTDTQKIELSVFKPGNLGKWFIFLSLIILGLRYALEQLHNINPLFPLTLIILLGAYLLYPLTFGRKNYLKLRKI
jgi:hypothetical protein